MLQYKNICDVASNLQCQETKWILNTLITVPSTYEYLKVLTYNCAKGQLPFPSPSSPGVKKT